MKAITLKQPYASLVVLGVKTWETRPHPFNGDMRPAGVRGLPGLRIDRGERIAIHAAATSPDPLWEGGPYAVAAEFIDGRRVDFLYKTSFVNRTDLPLGAIVGYVTVADTLPITGWADIGDPECIVMHGDGTLDHAIPTSHDDQGPDWGPKFVPDGAHLIRDVSDQLPYGHWTPGRWASLLVDPEPCEPIPAKGKQGVWEWTP